MHTPPDANVQYNILKRSMDMAAAAHIKTLAVHAERIAAAPITPAPDAIERAMTAAAINAESPVHCPVADFDKQAVDALRHLSEPVRLMCPDEVAILERHAAALRVPNI